MTWLKCVRPRTVQIKAHRLDPTLLIFKGICSITFQLIWGYFEPKPLKLAAKWHFLVTKEKP